MSAAQLEDGPTSRKVIFIDTKKLPTFLGNFIYSVILIEQGQKGYFAIKSRREAIELNEKPVSDDVIQSAIAASMFGWDIPAAKEINDWFAA